MLGGLVVPDARVLLCLGEIGWAPLIPVEERASASLGSYGEATLQASADHDYRYTTEAAYLRLGWPLLA